MATIKHLGYQGAVVAAGLAGFGAAVLVARVAADLVIGIGGLLLN